MGTRHLLCLIVLSFCSSAALAEQTFDDWSVDMDSEATVMHASTTNDSGEVLGELCFFESGHCSWVMGMPTRCDEDDTYPVLANSSSGAKHLVTTCMGQVGDGGDYLYSFEWKEIESVIKDAKWVGLAFPMDSDRFKVVRFSLDGIGPATEFLEGLFKRALNDPQVKPRNTKSEVM